MDRLYRDVPSGLGTSGKIRLSAQEVRTVLEEGAEWAVKAGYGFEADLEHTEEGGRMDGADASAVSRKAIERGACPAWHYGFGQSFSGAAGC